jgi:hypothetical protein
LVGFVEFSLPVAMMPFAPPGLSLERGSVRAPAMAQRLAMLQRKKTQETYIEDDATDAGSSDADSSCSSAMLQCKKAQETYIEDDTTDAGSSNADSSCSSGSESSLQSGRSFTDWAAASRLRRLAPRKLAMGKKVRFSSTPLDTIPGTPNAEQHMELPATTEQPEKKCMTTNAVGVLATAPPSVPTGHCTSTGKSHQNAADISKHSTEGMLARAKRQALPLKLRLPAHLERARRQLDPSMPAKKRPAYVEFTTATVADMQGLDPNVPLKMTVSRFLLEDSQQAVTYLAPR